MVMAPNGNGNGGHGRDGESRRKGAINRLPADEASSGSSDGAVAPGGISPWLGGEFLLWLWWLSETTDGLFDLPPDSRGEAVEPVAVMLDEELVLGGEPPAGGAGGCAVTALRTGAPAVSPEAAMALLTGKLPLRAKLVIARGERQWRLSLDSNTLDLRSVKVPISPESTKLEDIIVERLDGYGEAREVIEGLYGQFLGRRLGPAWEAEDAPEIRDWMREKSARAVAI